MYKIHKIYKTIRIWMSPIFPGNPWIWAGSPDFCGHQHKTMGIFRDREFWSFGRQLQPNQQGRKSMGRVKNKK